MKRIWLSGLIFSFCCSLIQAQTLEEGRKNLYHERFNTAREIFSKLVAANPGSQEAVYWLGQSLIELKDLTGARDLYAKTLQQNGNAPLVLVGMGHLELLEGKTSDARQRFDVALSLTNNKDLNVINAIGLANVRAKTGDAQYAVEKLNFGTQLKNFKSPETYIILGDAYRKLIEGGNAVSSFNKALALDPKYAAARYRIGKVYLTQNNREFFLPAFEEAIVMDPEYRPAYFELFYYWYFRDVNKAAIYLDGFVKNSDPGPDVEYLSAEFKYASSKFSEAQQMATQLIGQYGEKVAPRMFRLLAYANDTLGNSVAAKDAMLQYLSKAIAEDILTSDYEELGNIYAKIPGSENEAFNSFQLAVDKDNVLENKVKIIARAAALAKKMGNRKKEADWLGVAYALNKNPSQNDLYNWGLAHYQAGNYATSDSIFCGLYQSKYPSQIFGYLWCARSKQAMDDSSNSNGLAVEAYKVLAEKARQFDSVKFKSQAISSYFYLVQYYNDVAKNKEVAISYCDSVLRVDSTNADAIRVKTILTGPPPKQPSNKKPAAPSGNKPVALLFPWHREWLKTECDLA